METKTLLAKIVTRLYPYNGQDALVIIQSRGTEEVELIVERGWMNDKEMSLLLNDYQFVQLVPNGTYYRINKIIEIDDFLLRAELISIPKNGVKG